MDYSTELMELNDNAFLSGKKKIKYLPGKCELGFIGPKVKTEIENSLSRNKENRSLKELRSGAGCKNRKDISKNEIKIEEQLIRGIPVRSYTRIKSEKSMPALLIIHGGGFFSGSLDNIELPCKLLADKADIRVFSIDYRLSPEHTYPSAVLDCQLVLDELYQNYEDYGIDPKRMYIMGDSAGGNLSLVTTLLDRQLGCNRIAGQILVYPAVSLRKEDSLVDWSEYEDKENTGLLKPYFDKMNQSIDQIYQWYAQGVDLDNSLLSPLTAGSNTPLPRTLIMCGEYDFLKKQCEAFFSKFSQCNEIDYIEYGGMNHAFMDKIGEFPQAEDCCIEAIKFIRKDDEKDE